MMQSMAKVCKIDSYEVKTGASFFFDNNVWMFLFAPIANAHKGKQKKYASLFRTIQAMGGTIFISSLVLSEYVNRCLRLAFNQWKEDTRQSYGVEYKKDYRKTEDYRLALEDVKGQVMAILKCSERMPDDFNAINIEALLNTMSDGDYNDSYYAQLCKMKGLKIVTDDHDMFQLPNEVEIITA